VSSNQIHSASKGTQQKRLILDSALRLLADEGHASLTVRRVAAESGCSTIGVYTWFGGKDGLIDAIWIEGFASFGAALSRAKRLTGPLGLLRAQATAYRKWALKHSRYYRVMFMNAVIDHEPSEEALLVSRAAFAALQGAVADALSRNEIGTHDPDSVALACWGLAHGLVSLELATNIQQPPGGTKHAPQFNDSTYSNAVNALLSGFTLSA
jgi:AcrR family transcriptional regulator